ncbi:MAG: Ulp1 family isopeptidase [Sedimenticola sp.]
MATLEHAYSDGYVKPYLAVPSEMKVFLACISSTSTIENGQHRFETGIAKSVGRFLLCNTLSVSKFTEDPHADYKSFDKLSTLLEMRQCLKINDCSVGNMLKNMFCEYLFRYVPMSLQELFGIGYIEQMFCNTCGKHQSNQKHCYVGNVMSFDDFAKQKIEPGFEQSPTVTQCHGANRVTICLSSVGASIAIQSSGLAAWNLLNSTKTIVIQLEVYPHITVRYEPVTLICKDLDFVLFCQPFYRILKSSGEFLTIAQMRDLHEPLTAQDKIIVLFNKGQENCQELYQVAEVNTLAEVIYCKNACATYAPDTLGISKDVLANFTDSFAVNGLRMTAEDCSAFYGGLLTDNCIDVYLEHLKGTIPATPDFTYHFVPAAWFKEKLKVGLENVAQKSTCWFSQSDVILPINIENEHWILCIINIKSLTVFYIDSLGKFDRKIAQKIAGYLAYEHYVYLQKPLDTSLLKFVLVANAKDFRMQTDAMSCGIYVCLYARCYIHKCIPDSSKTTNIAEYRCTFLNELLQSYYFQAAPEKITLKDIILCEGMETHLKNIMCSSKQSLLMQYVRHKGFLRNLRQREEKTMFGFASDLLGKEQEYVINMYLYKRYFRCLRTYPRKVFSLTCTCCIFEDAEDLNKCFMSGISDAVVYVSTVLWKEALVFCLMKVNGETYNSVNKKCQLTEKNTHEMIAMMKKARSNLPMVQDSDL